MNLEQFLIIKQAESIMPMPEKNTGTNTGNNNTSFKDYLNQYIKYSVPSYITKARESGGGFKEQIKAYMDNMLAQKALKNGYINDALKINQN